MNIIDNKMLLTQQMRGIIEKQASVKFGLGKFHSLHSIHEKLKVDIIIEDKCPNKYPALLENALKRKLMQLDILQACKREDEKVLIAEKQKLEKHIEGLKRILGKKVVLGEYKSNESNIYLYIETITSFSDWEKYLKTTYIHEMFHAYFDRDSRKHIPYYYQIEEPLAEAGMLLYLHKTNDVDLSWALQNVQNKMPLLAEYAFGADLYELWINRHFALETIIRNYKFEMSDDWVGKATDIVKNIYSRPVIKNKDSFKRWLVVVKGYARSTANGYSIMLNNINVIRDLVLIITKGRTSEWYEMSRQEFGLLKSHLFTSVYTITRKLGELYCSENIFNDIKMRRMMDLYEEFLSDQLWQTLYS